jgi:hypothetical protein
MGPLLRVEVRGVFLSAALLARESLLGGVSCLHPEDSGGSEAAELDLGDGVAGSGRVSPFALFCAIYSLSLVAYLGPYLLLKVSYGWRRRHCWTPKVPSDLRPYKACFWVSAFVQRSGIVG